MRKSTDFKKLHKKIETEKKFKQNSYHKRSGGHLFTDSKKGELKENTIMRIKDKLTFFKHLLDIINDGATGFELAYEIEKNQEVKSLIFDGILFYNTLIEIGNKKFLDAPDKVKVDYRSFKTIEDTEKFIFLVWLKDQINSLEKRIQPKEDYAKFIETKKAQEIKEAMEKLRERLTHCKNCGARVQSKEQLLCEECGMTLMESITQK
ncbi:MAG: hypothetical protein ACXAC5_16470 [Promethearchaeota archaeon]|jgi:hypothetical protein